MSILSTETHDYDGKVGNTYNELVSRIRINEKHYGFKDAAGYLWVLSERDERAKESLRLLIKDHGTSNNFDPSDGIDCDLLLTFIGFMMETEKCHLSLLDYRWVLEQMGDISSSGPCPQGRGKRLLQIATSLSSSSSPLL
jgi:hypothetical protein